ncbi:MAG TPA: thiamine pyrophosphate-binding protein [Solirubrobacteraceae bacterium]|jgi:acetolactate synthase-1/2/3 large subunit|nr:thiamine pyrophosphate-binding protein [Solirubrobacteraceae bacterium]
MPERVGGHLVAESLAALGAEAAFGVPGIHALAIWEGLRESSIRVYGNRTELSAGFAADGYARSSGHPAPLLLSTGPGALNSLTAIMEAASSHVPVVAISSQIPADLVGRGRGYLHELPDQLASFAPLVKYAARAHSVESIPGLLAQAWRIALTPPSGPVFVEIPVDLLKAPAVIAPVTELEAMVARQCAPLEQVGLAATALAHARRPVIWAGGGVIRSGARPELRELAELLDAPVATTYMGKGALPDEHPLAAGSGCDEAALQELLSGADVVLCVGTELGAETTADYSLDLPGQVIHLDAAPERIGVTYSALPLVGDAKLTLLALVAELSPRPPRPPSDAPDRVAAVRRRIRDGLATQDRAVEMGLLASIAQILPADAITAWDMTILGYWAAPHLPVSGGQQFLYPLGSGTLGYAWPAALGARAAHPQRPVLAVVGDGGLQYALAELGTAAQHRIAAKLLVIDDGGYGILREYQRDEFGETTAVELPGKDIEAIAASFGVPVRTATPEDLADQLAWALALDGPAVVVLHQRIAAARPTA